MFIFYYIFRYSMDRQTIIDALIYNKVYMDIDKIKFCTRGKCKVIYEEFAVRDFTRANLNVLSNKNYTHIGNMIKILKWNIFRKTYQHANNLIIGKKYNKWKFNNFVKYIESKQFYNKIRLSKTNYLDQLRFLLKEIRSFLIDKGIYIIIYMYIWIFFNIFYYLYLNNL